MAGIRLVNLIKRFGKVEVVKNVSLEVRDGEFTVLVGPSGCGKSTTLRMIAGLEDISEGEIYIGERLVNDLAPKDRDIAMVFQEYALYPHMTVYDNMAFSLRMRGFSKSEIEQRVRESAEILGLDELLKRKPRELSGGQRQRVALGRAIVRKPVVFLFDEPLSNLDAKLRVHMRAELIKLYNRLKTTIVYVTHDQVEAMTMGTKIVIMKDGEIHQVGSPMEVYRRPVNQFVASFIGSPSMNFFNSTILSNGGGLTIDAGCFRVQVPVSRQSAYQPHVGQDVIFGIRPTDISGSETGKDEGDFAPIDGHVEVVEPLGSEILLVVKCCESSFLAMVDAEVDVAIGQTIRLNFNMAKMHVFEAAEPHRRLGI
ncbi:MAG: sn-glycerol-3-phosphate ABC transporter ATP-binding protein UgpC [Syntrophales bacterium]|nr:sn-glycerol-3-phosphate ABC transporter ATP-binding protein UgpC [Syntrophales bacterium]